jgi:murein DD-endopeptidase MepM/ murein hydrolase activator NlpD
MQQKTALARVISIFIFLSVLFYSCQSTEQAPKEIPASKFEYEICVDSLSVVTGKIEKNQTLGELLYLHHVDHPEISKIVSKSKDIFDFRTARVNKSFTVLCNNDSVAKARYFIYEISAIEYVVFDIGEAINVYKGKKEVEVRIRKASGIIETSLSDALTSKSMSYDLVHELSSNIYAWTIDFFRIQKGDYFYVVFEERYVEDQFIGIGKVITANFNHRNQDHFAFYFEEEENFGDYFDEKGGTLRKAFLRAPLNFSRISSSFSKRRKHPVTGRIKAHLGTDYAAPTGTKILSTANGIVTEARYKRNNGNYVKIRHNATYTTQYLHMSKIKKGIRPGVRVKQGDVIGYVGSTGLATGPHVCYRFWKNGVQVNPYKQDLPPGKPIKDQNLQEFTQLRDSLMTVLNSISLEK